MPAIMFRLFICLVVLTYVHLNMYDTKYGIYRQHGTIQAVYTYDTTYHTPVYLTPLWADL